MRKNTNTKLASLAVTTAIALTLMTSLSPKTVHAEAQLAIPNPFLANTTYSTVHSGSGYGCFSSVAGPIDVKRPLNDSELSWRPTELASWSINYSNPYPNDKRVAWTGGGKTLFKYDADTLELIDSLQVRDGKAMSAEEVTNHVNKLDSLSGKDYYQLAVDTLLPEMGGAASFYKLISKDNELFVLVNDIVNKKTTLRVYGDAVADDPSSKIELKREWTLPKVADVVPFGFSVNMAFDGQIIITTRDGTLFAVSQDLKEYTHLVLPDGGKKTKGMADSFLRNAPPIDPDGGIYVVTHDVMHRVQWTGKKLSIDEKDGAWSAPYAGGVVGSGTSPALMGWGENDDKLVLTGDGRPNGKMHLLAFWRDEIPEDWQGIEGQDRRIAGMAPVDYGEYTPDVLTVENSPAVKGYGVYITNDASTAKLTDDDYQGPFEGKWLAGYYAIGKDKRFIPRGGLKYEWNPKERTFDLAWSTDRSFTSTVPVVDINNTLYGIGWRDNNFTMEAVDWHTGESKFHYTLGSSNRFSIMGASLSIAPNGALDCPCQTGVGLVRIHPQADKK